MVILIIFNQKDKNLGDQKSILFIIGGGIAAYKSLEIIRGLKKVGAKVRAILTNGGSQFITPLSVSSLTGEKTYTDLFSLYDETEMGHIRLSREADLIVVSPATADIIAKMANGFAGDLASTTILANNKPILICPAMNLEMWENPATQKNINILKNNGVLIVDPEEGEMACGEFGVGRLAEVETILNQINDFFLDRPLPLKGKKALITAGPTYEAIDPVRYIANRSSGKQGYAVARSLRDMGAEVTLISGPTKLKAPLGLNFISIESAQDMFEAAKTALPSDIIIGVAAVSDWKAITKNTKKIKKEAEKKPTLQLDENPDILKEISSLSPNNRNLIIGFAAETENLILNAKTKRLKKGCDWIVANDVSLGTGTMGGDQNKVFLITSDETEEWPYASKDDVAQKLATKIKDHFKGPLDDK